MPMIRASLSALLAPGLNEVYSQNNDYKQYPPEFSIVFDVDSSDRQFEEEVVMTGFPTMPSKKERDPVIYEDALLGTTKRYTNVTYALGFRVSEELWEDELYGTIKALPKELAFSARDVVEVTSAGVFINGFTDSADYLGPDGEPLFGDGTNKTHPMLGGGTWVNQLNPAADLNPDSLELAINDIEATTNDRGLLIMLKAQLLIVPTQLQWIADELLNSDLKPHVSTNEINPLQTKDLKYTVWHYLTDPDAWFIRAQKHYLKFFWRIKDKLTNSDDFDTGDAKFKSRQRFIQGYTDTHGIYGSPGS